MEEILREFIEWSHENSPDAWWIYEHTDEAIEKFMAFRDAEEDE